MYVGLFSKFSDGNFIFHTYHNKGVSPVCALNDALSSTKENAEEIASKFAPTIQQKETCAKSVAFYEKELQEKL